MREWIKKHMPKQGLSLYQKFRYLWITGLFHLFHLFRIKKNRVVFCNIWGYGDNARYIAEELAKRPYKFAFQEPKLFFITNHPENAHAPNKIHLIRTNSVKAVFMLATAHVWVDSNRKEGYIRKRKGQYYIQTWHGGVPLKKIEGDCAKYLGSDYIRRAKWDSAMTDLYLSNGGFCTKMYQRAFWYKKEVMECGTPRLDRLIKPSEARKLATRSEFAINKEHKIVLYAPTYRERGNTKAYIADLNGLVAALEQRFQENFTMLVRLHPLSADLSSIYQYNKKILDASHSSDMYELMELADILVTDYSNTMFEFALTGKCVFLYTMDQDKYAEERGLYFKMSELPFPVSETENQLKEQILQFDDVLYREKLKEFFTGLNAVETGHASKLAADKILSVLSVFRQ